MNSLRHVILWLKTKILLLLLYIRFSRAKESMVFSNECLIFSSELKYKCSSILFEDNNQTIKEDEINLPAAHVCLIKNIVLKGDEAIGIVKNKFILYDSVLAIEGCLYHSNIKKIVTKIQNPRILNVKYGFSLLNAWSESYYHWIIECLPLLEGYELFCKKNNIESKIIVGKTPQSFQIETLGLLGYTSENFIYWDFDIANINNFITSSVRRYRYQKHQYVIDPRAITWLRNKVLQKSTNLLNEDIFHSQYIYISRNKAGSRRVINESDVFQDLAQMGFKMFYLEDLNFYEQLNLFYHAKCIIAPHGAGLTNLIFSKDGKVIELFGPQRYLLSDYYKLSKIVELSYHFFVEKAIGLDLEVDKQRLISYVKSEIINKK